MDVKIAFDPSKLKLVDPKSLKLDPNNRNKHPTEQIDRFCRLLKEYGMRWPILVSERTGLIKAGEGRLLAALKLGMPQVLVTYQDFESDQQEYGFGISDNAIALWAELDLSSIQTDIKDMPDLDIDMLGIEDFEVIETEKLEPGCDEDEVPDVQEPTTRLGDLYVLGNHRLLCGDSTSISDVERLMGSVKADMVFTDPPYNVDYSNQDRPKAGKRDLGRIENDSMSAEAFKEFLVNAISNGFLVTKEDSSAYIWYASKESVNFITACQQSGWEINQQIIWKKPMLLGRGRYQWAHEPCIFAVKGKPWFTDDRTKTTVWDFGGYDKSKNVHPTQKPVVLAEEAISNSSKIGSHILDLFGGSGSTLIACEKTNRKCFMMELDPHYCDVIVSRWKKYSGKKAEILDGKA